MYSKVPTIYAITRAFRDSSYLFMKSLLNVNNFKPKIFFKEFNTLINCFWNCWWCKAKCCRSENILKKLFINNLSWLAYGLWIFSVTNFEEISWFILGLISSICSELLSQSNIFGNRKVKPAKIERKKLDQFWNYIQLFKVASK